MQEWDAVVDEGLECVQVKINPQGLSAAEITQESAVVGH